jgi:hypothetical protein
MPTIQLNEESENRLVTRVDLALGNRIKSKDLGNGQFFAIR